MSVCWCVYFMNAPCQRHHTAPELPSLRGGINVHNVINIRYASTVRCIAGVRNVHTCRMVRVLCYTAKYFDHIIGLFAFGWEFLPAHFLRVPNLPIAADAFANNKTENLLSVCDRCSFYVWHRRWCWNDDSEGYLCVSCITEHSTEQPMMRVNRSTSILYTSKNPCNRNNNIQR